MWSRQTSQVASLEYPAAPETGELAHLAAHTSGTNADEFCINGALAEPISLKCYRLTVGKAAKVTADVVAQEVIVHGQIAGNLNAADRIEIKRDAVVTANLTTAHVFIEEGAYFKGKLQIERPTVPRATSPGITPA